MYKGCVRLIDRESREPRGGSWIVNRGSHFCFLIMSVNLVIIKSGKRRRWNRGREGGVHVKVNKVKKIKMTVHIADVKCDDDGCKNLSV